MTALCVQGASIRTTVAKIEELLQIANEYDDLLLRQLARTDARVKLISG